MYTKLTLIGLLIGGCNSKFNADNYERGATPTVASTCEATVRTVSPASDGQSNFYFRDNVIFSLSEGSDAAEVELTTLDGTIVTGSTWIDDQVDDEEDIRVVFTPDEPLAPGTEYSAMLAYCGGTPSVNFRTSSLGTPIENPATLLGSTYTMDLSEARVVKPGVTAQALLTILAR